MLTCADALQSINNLFNLKAYGLAVNLLHNNIYLQWAINKGKTVGGIDFTATVKQVRPANSDAKTLSFKAGPLIIPAELSGTALTIIDQFNSKYSSAKVNVYQLVNDAQIPIMYNIVHKPFVAVLNSGKSYDIQTA